MHRTMTVKGFIVILSLILAVFLPEKPNRRKRFGPRWPNCRKRKRT